MELSSVVTLSAKIDIWIVRQMEEAMSLFSLVYLIEEATHVPHRQEIPMNLDAEGFMELRK